jgi:thermitase
VKAIRRILAVVLFPTVVGTMIGQSLGAIDQKRQYSTGNDKKVVVTPRQNQTQILLRDREVARNWGLEQTESWEAWRLSKGSRDIVVAVVDTGIDVNHPDLKENLWTNPGEAGLDGQGNDKSSNGIDDDGNGYIDDVHGWNFVHDNNNISDNHGHGTHIAGIIGGANGGVAPHVSIMVLKYFDPEARDLNPMANTVKAIRYATKMGAKIINYSGGGLNPNPLEAAAIRAAAAKDILLVAAAGNEKSNSDIHGYYPADYGLPNIMSVTAIDENERILPSSNYGIHSVDIAAPGENIYSTLPGGGYGFMTGTSQATAFATGVAVLLMAQRPELQKPEQLIAHMIDTGFKDEDLRGKTRKQTILNSYRALAIIDRHVAAFGEAAENAAYVDTSAFMVGK